MKKEQINIKPALTMQDRILMPQELTEGYFVTDEAGYVQYAPYYADMMLINVFFLHCVDGLSFDMEEGSTVVRENVYEAVINDEELMELYHEFFEWDKDSIQTCPYQEAVIQMYGILSDTDKMVEYRKQQLIHRREDTFGALLAAMTDKIKHIDPDKLNLKEAVEALRDMRDIQNS